MRERLPSKPRGEVRPRQYRATVKENGLEFFLGRYATKEEARVAREQFKRAASMDDTQ